MHTGRFDTIAIELKRLSAEMVEINAQPFNFKATLEPTVGDGADRLLADTGEASSASADLMFSSQERSPLIS